MGTRSEILRAQFRRGPGIGSAGPGHSQGPPTAAEFFDARAPVYDDAYEANGSGGHTLRARLEIVLELAGHGPGEALDVGMGPGRLCLALAERGWAVSGVDPSRAMVDRARERLGPEARVLRASLDPLPFADASFDVVAATGVMEYLHDRPAALREIARVLRPGGLAVVSVPNPVALYARVNRPYMRTVGMVHRVALRSPLRRPVGGRPIRARAFGDMLAAAGLRPHAIRHAGYLVVPLPFDNFVPKLAGRLADRVEARGPRLGAMLATQVVFAAGRTSQP